MGLSGSTLELLFRARMETDGAKKSSADLREALVRDSKAIEKSASDVDKTGGEGISGLAGKFDALKGAVTPVTAVIGASAAAVAGFATAAYKVGETLFSLANKASEYGSKIKDASDKTGLSAETLSSLQLAADQSGSSLEQVTSSISKFSKLIAEAAEGNKQATETLKRLGIDPQEAIRNLDGALEKVFKRIVSLPPGVTQTKAAMDAFGRSGADLLPFIKSFDGDMAALIQRAKELGVAIDDDAANAADEFGDTLDDLKAQADGLTRQFALQFMPVFTEGMKDLSRWFADNKSEVKEWGTSVAGFLRGVIQAFKEIVEFYNAHPILSRVLLGVATFGVSEGVINTASTAKTIGENQLPSASMGGKTKFSGGDYLEDKDATEKARRENAALAKRDVVAAISGWQTFLAQVRGNFDKTVKKFQEDLAQTGNGEAYRDNIKTLVAWYIENAGAASEALTKLENKQAAVDKKTANERALLRQQQQQRDADWQEKYIQTQAEVDKVVFEGQQKVTTKVEKETEKRLNISEESVRREIALREKATGAILSNIKQALAKGTITEDEAIKKRHVAILADEEWQKLGFEGLLQFKRRKLTELLETVKGNAEKEAAVKQEIAELDEEIKQTESDQNTESVEKIRHLEKERDLRHEILTLTAAAADAEKGEQTASGERHGGAGAAETPASDGAEAQGGFLFGLSEELKNFFPHLDEAGGRLEAFKSLALNAVGSIASAVGQLVQQWVLLGNASGASIQKMVAAALAGAAAQAATWAVFAFAYGLLQLAMFNFDGAAKAFLSAAQFGAIALGTGLAGRAIAGNSFKQETQSAYGSAGGQSSQSGQNSSGGNNRQGGSYSSLAEKIVELSRNTPQGSSDDVTNRDAQKVQHDLNLHLKLAFEDFEGQVMDVLVSSLRKNSRQWNDINYELERMI